jgi:cation:H+ antiporter
MLIVTFFLGLTTLIVGAELLVRGASRLAKAAGLSPLVIGLTVVSYGTGSPELAVGVKAGMAGQAGIALGNVVGSNSFSVLLVLGLSALVAPLTVSSRLVRLDVPVMIGASLLMWAFASNRVIARWEGGILVAGVIVYTALLIRLGRREDAASPDPGGLEATPAASREGYALPALLVLAGLGLLTLGANRLVEGAAGLARLLGVSDLLIGLTVVAAGTSLPEAATSVVASLRGERDIAVGNVVGSNIFNILAVLGASAAVSGHLRVPPPALHFDIPVMTAVMLVCLPIFFTAGRISRWEGGLFLGYYAVYIGYLFLKASEHEALPLFNSVVLWFALPATAIGIGASLFHALRGRRVTRGPAAR